MPVAGLSPQYGLLRAVAGRRARREPRRPRQDVDEHAVPPSPGRGSRRRGGTRGPPTPSGPDGVAPAGRAKEVPVDAVGDRAEVGSRRQQRRRRFVAGSARDRDDLGAGRAAPQKLLVSGGDAVAVGHAGYLQNIDSPKRHYQGAVQVGQRTATAVGLREVRVHDVHRVLGDDVVQLLALARDAADQRPGRRARGRPLPPRRGGECADVARWKPPSAASPRRHAG